MMRVTDFLFELPEELIAQTPLDDRGASRMLVLDKNSGGILHSGFRDIIEILNQGDCIVLNETKVIPARLMGTRDSGAQVELLLLRRLDANRWESLVRPGRKARVGDRILFDPELQAVVEDIADEGNRIIRFEYSGVFEQILDRLGEAPLPPYIREKLKDRSRYQTVYAKHEGSAAAPTAGLHFTNEILGELSEKGVNIARITLHVGLGTFRPVKTENIIEHKMHSEFYNIEPSQAEVINAAKSAGGRIIAVGTTVCRTLETCANNGRLNADSGNTEIFIYPGYKFKIIDGLITNFHLPGSTLIMLVAALAGRENVLKAYEEAVERGYRFYSFGDAMLIV